MPDRHQFAIVLGLALLFRGAPSEGAALPLSGVGGVAALCDSLLGRVPHRDARVIEVAGDGTARLEIGAGGDIGQRTRLTFVRRGLETAIGDRVVGAADGAVREAANRVAVRSAADGGIPWRLENGLEVSAYLARHLLALALLDGPPIPGTTRSALLRALESGLLSPILATTRLPAFVDTSEALQEARRTGADSFGWLSAESAPGGCAIRLDLFSVKDLEAAPPLTWVIPTAELPPADPAREDPAGTLPGCRPVGLFRSDGAPGLDAVPRRFRRDVVDVIHEDRIDSWRLNGEQAVIWQSYRFDPEWPVAAATRWPVATMLPLNSYFAPDRSEARVTYTLCSNQRPRHLLVSTVKARPDSLDLAVSDGPLDSLNGCTAGCFPRVNRLDPLPGSRRPDGLPPTASVRIALGRVDVGPTGLPAFDANGFVKTRKSAVILYDPPSATLWLSAPDTAFQVPGRFGDEIETYRVGRAGPPGFLVTAAAPLGEPDRLEFWVWEKNRLSCRWRSEAFPGSITALYAGDLDGDAREDLWLAALDGPGRGARTVFHYYRAAANPVGRH